MTPKAGTSCSNSFTNQTRKRSWLSPAKTGSVGLNLECANKVFFMDPWWNPSVEEQAVGRVHRIGQRKEAGAIRFITEESIEARIIKLSVLKSKWTIRLWISTMSRMSNAFLSQKKVSSTSCPWTNHFRFPIKLRNQTNQLKSRIYINLRWTIKTIQNSISNQASHDIFLMFILAIAVSTDIFSVIKKQKIEIDQTSWERIFSCESKAMILFISYFTGLLVLAKYDW